MINIKYLIYVIVALVTGLVSYLILSRYNVVYSLKKNNGEGADKINPFSKGFTTFWIVFVFISNFLLVLNTHIHTKNIISIIKLLTILLLLETVAIIDAKLRIIPNKLMLFALGVRLVLYIFEFIFFKDDFKPILKSDFIGFCFGFGLLLLASLISKGGMGFGDVKLFGVIGITAGFTCTFSTLFVALIGSAIYGIITLLTKKHDKKSSVPFGPFVYVGYLVCMALAVY